MGLMSRISLGLLVAFSSTIVHAQQYPSKPIRMVVSIAAGSVTDVIMRAAAAELQPRLSQPLIIENIGGAAGILGGKTCAQATGDGYTICVIYHSTMSFNPLLFTNLPYNPDTDIVPVSRLFFLVEGLFAASTVGATMPRILRPVQPLTGSQSFCSVRAATQVAVLHPSRTSRQPRRNRASTPILVSVTISSDGLLP